MFALAQESGMDKKTRQKILNTIAKKDLDVLTDPAASPTGFPFKVLQLPNTLSDPVHYAARTRACNLGYLRTPYLRKDGTIGYRCPSEPVERYIAKGGNVADTVGRKCLCNALCADAGFPQVRRVGTMDDDDDGNEVYYVEKNLVTVGDDVNRCRRFMKLDEEGNWNYSARDVVDYLKSSLEEREARRRRHSLGEDTSRMKELHEIVV